MNKEMLNLLKNKLKTDTIIIKNTIDSVTENNLLDFNFSFIFHLQTNNFFDFLIKFYPI